MHQVHSQLYISDLDSAEDPPEEVDTVINLSGGIRESTDIFYPLRDSEMKDQQRFNGAVKNVVKRLEEGETLLVHCAAGVSRSVGVSVAAISEYEEINSVESFQRIKEKRPVANPRPGIKKHYRKYLGEMNNGKYF